MKGTNRAARNFLKIILTVLLALSLPLVLVEYFSLFWFSFGGTAFSAIATPVLFAIAALALLLAKKKLKLKETKNAVAIYGIVVLAPIIAMLLVSLMAAIFQIDMNIM